MKTHDSLSRGEADQIDLSQVSVSSAAGSLGLHVGLIFWLFAIALSIGYFIVLFRSFRGKVNLSEAHHQ